MRALELYALLQLAWPCSKAEQAPLVRTTLRQRSIFGSIGNGTARVARFKESPEGQERCSRAAHHSHLPTRTFADDNVRLPRNVHDDSFYVICLSWSIDIWFVSLRTESRASGADIRRVLERTLRRLCHLEIRIQRCYARSGSSWGRGSQATAV